MLCNIMMFGVQIDINFEQIDYIILSININYGMFKSRDVNNDDDLFVQ